MQINNQLDGGQGFANGSAAAAVAGHDLNGSRLMTSLRVARPLRVVTLGDSLISGNDASVNHANSSSWYEQLQARSLGHLTCIKRAGVPGDTSTEVAARFASDVTANDPDVVFLQSGTNDLLYSGATNAELAEQICANDVLMIRAALAAGIIPVLCALFPVSATGYESKGAVVVYVNAAKKKLADEWGVDWLDVWAQVANPDGSWITGCSADGIHTNTHGAIAVASATVSKYGINSILLSAPFLPVTYTDAASKLPNPLLLDSDSDGIPDNWGDASGELPGVYSITPSSFGNVFRVSKTTAAQRPHLVVNASAGLAAGQVFDLCFRWKVFGTATGLRPAIQLSTYGTATDGLWSYMYGISADGEGIAFLRGTLGSGYTGCAFDINLGSAGTGYVEVSQLALYPVA